VGVGGIRESREGGISLHKKTAEESRRERGREGGMLGTKNIRGVPKRQFFLFEKRNGN